jgi:hypothetical protein
MTVPRKNGPFLRDDCNAGKFSASNPVTQPGALVQSEQKKGHFLFLLHRDNVLKYARFSSVKL